MITKPWPDNSPEILLDDPVPYGERFENAGGIIQVHAWQGMVHVFPSSVNLLQAAKEALDDIGDFLRQPLPGEANHTTTDNHPQTFQLEKSTR